MTALTDDIVWQTKLHARTHDPAEKALVLFRDPAGHEGGTVRQLSSLFFEDGVVPANVRRHVKWADWWASAADRPQLPKRASWAQLRWTSHPVLVHPLTGKEFDLHKLVDTEVSKLKARSFEHFKGLIVRDHSTDGGSPQIDYRRTALAYWRFGPEIGVADEADGGKLGALWQHLPADTRIPDHSIWDHLDLTSAFAGAFAEDGGGEAAVLALSIGPVQSFIAAARSTSDLWAGSHLLARLSWEAMRVVCERLGPDAILFPRLRGIPQVDLWLRDDCGLDAAWFEKCEWAVGATDANPLFAAALPNRFVALVPADAAAELAEAVTRHVRRWLRTRGGEVVDRLLKAAEFDKNEHKTRESAHAHNQMREQIAGFPEVHWAAAPFSLIRPRDKERQTDLDTKRLNEAMAPFLGVPSGEECGFLDSPAWQVLRKELGWESAACFHSPNPGMLYPAVYDLAERVLAAAKAVRKFDQTEQRGWRCSLTGETEWLTTDPEQLDRSYRGRGDTLWARVANRRPAWAKRGEHLGALPAIKRLWPTLFAEEAGKALGENVDRFVVSTHAMTLAAQIERWLEKGGVVSDALRDVIQTANPVPAALPRRLSRRYGQSPAFGIAKKLPELLGAASDADGEQGQKDIEKTIKAAVGLKAGNRIETYYGLLLMDGDRMGRILSGADSRMAITYAESFHPKVRRGFKGFASDHPEIEEYLRLTRAMSPNRHLAISAALNDFALRVVPEVIEREHLGRVLYAGGDDVLAMLPTADLLPAMRRLRYAWSGHDPRDARAGWREARRSKGLCCKDGFALLRGRLLRMMGHKATASCGAVVAHHQAPLTAVLRELRAAERRAKDEGRNRFHLTILKRSGGALCLTAEWEEMGLLLKVRDFLAEPRVSRRAAYHTLTWLRDLPEDADIDLLATIIAYQFGRQTAPGDRASIKCRHDLPNLARRLAGFACGSGANGGGDSASSSVANGLVDRAGIQRRRLADFLSAAEFLAREARSPIRGDSETPSEPVSESRGAA